MDVWQMIEYSLVVSIVALLLLAMKRLFHDKLDARWHYFIWAVLVVRMAVPLKLEWFKSPLSLFEAIPVNYWTKLWGLMADRAGIGEWIQDLFPWYVAGAVLLAAYYLVLAVIVRVRTLTLPQADEACRARVTEVAAKYGLKPCKRIHISAQGTPYVCGLFWPVLVLPRQEVTEEMIVHELLHKKYGDVLINYGLHLMRVINWFNPFIWYATAVMLNDSEALCDQRVLELMREQEDYVSEGKTYEDSSVDKETAERGYEGAAEEPIEKVYGNLLISMAPKRGAHSAKIGTTNMANSYSNMKTRIKRIADFRRVPAGVGFVALSITIILSVSSIGYCEAQNIISCGVENERDLNRVLMRALTYEAETKEEALYLYLMAMQGMNPVYLMSVMPEEELPKYEAWIYEMFRQDKFIQWHQDNKVYIGVSGNAMYRGIPEWVTLDADNIENPWFVWDGMYMTYCNIYGLEGDDIKGSALAELTIKKGAEYQYVVWELELLNQKGWKVRRLSEQVNEEPLVPEPAVSEEVSGGDWLIEVCGWNEGGFPSIFQSNSGMTYYAGNVPTLLEKEKAAEYAKELAISYKHTRVFATYLGETSLEGKRISIETKVYNEDEWQEVSADTVPANREYPIGGEYSSSDGSSRKNMEGAEVQYGEQILLNGYGDGFDRWEDTEEIHFIVRIYYDGECVEVIRK